LPPLPQILEGEGKKQFDAASRVAIWQAQLAGCSA